MDYNKILQINWSFIFFMILSYLTICVLIIQLLVRSPRSTANYTLEENLHLLAEINTDSDEEGIYDNDIQSDQQSKNLTHLDIENNETDILISMENNYINDIDSLYNIETNN